MLIRPLPAQTPALRLRAPAAVPLRVQLPDMPGEPRTCLNLSIQSVRVRCEERMDFKTSIKMILGYMIVVYCVVFGGTLKLCENDGDCDEGLYCYMKTKTCTPCVQCYLYRRRQNFVGLCVKDASQCGGCLDGFEPEVLTDGRTRDLCVPSMSQSIVSPAAPQIMSEAHLSWGPYAIVIVLGFLFMTFLILLIKKSIRENVKVNFRTTYRPSADSKNALSAVLYEPSAPPHCNPACKDDLDLDMATYRCNYKEDEVLHCASKFLDPVYVKAPNVPPSEGANQDEVDAPTNLQNDNQPYLIDETTLPSSWTPGPEYVVESGNPSHLPLVTSFAGVLQLNSTANADAHQSRQEQPDSHTASGPQVNHTPLLNVTNITVINSNSNCATGVYNISTN